MPQFDPKQIDEIFAPLDRCHAPGAAVGIAIAGQPVYRKAFGLANVELPMVLSASMRMGIYSITKHFTCLAYLLLCEEGRAGIDDPVGRYLTDLHPVNARVTARQLMGNTSGLRDAGIVNWQFSGTGLRLSCAEVLALYRDIDDVSFEPNAAWCYNNGGYLLLSAMIERIAGRPLEVELRQRIFEPAGLRDTSLRRFDTDFLSNCAAAHVVAAEGQYEKGFLGADVAGAGGIVSTVEDMLRWLAHMDAPRVGSAATWRAMKTPQTLSNGTSTGYGFGLIASRYRGIETLFHAGGGVGGSSQMLKIPSVGLDVVVMSNRQDLLATKLASEIVDRCVAQLEPIRQPSGAPFASGVYLSAATGRVVQLYRNDGMQMVAIDSWDRPVTRGDDGVFRPLELHSYLQQPFRLVGDAQCPSAVMLDDFGTIDELLPVPSASCTQPLMGRYRSEATGIEAVIFTDEEGVRLSTIGWHGRVHYRLQSLAQDIWRATGSRALPACAIVRFVAEDSFEFRANRNSLRFHRVPTP